MPQRIQYKLWVPVGHCVVHAPLVTCKTLSDRSRTLNNGVVCALHSQPISSSSHQDAQQPANRPFTVVGRTAWNRMPQFVAGRLQTLFKDWPFYSPETKHSFEWIMEILYGAKTVFTCSAITPPKVNRFGWNLEHREHIVGDWPRQILGAIPEVATVWKAGEICFFFCPVDNARFRLFPVAQISINFNITTFIGEDVKTFGTEFWKFYRNGLFFQKNRKNCSQKFQVLRPGRHNFAMITDRRKFTSKLTFY